MEVFSVPYLIHLAVFFTQWVKAFLHNPFYHMGTARFFFFFDGGLGEEEENYK